MVNKYVLYESITISGLNSICYKQTSRQSNNELLQKLVHSSFPFPSTFRNSKCDMAEKATFSSPKVISDASLYTNVA